MGKVLKWTRNILILFFISSILGVCVLRFIPVYYTPLMFTRLFDQVAEGKMPKLHHHWVPMSEISHNMPQAVMASEDNLFLRHNGFDFKQMDIVFHQALKGKRTRGASTISQQTAKNVFLWQGRSYIRKGLEVYFTFLIEHIWGKHRIMEVYLNSIEMGDGIYGVEAVAHDNFGKHASELTKRQAALIAATLPNPRRWDSANPSPYMIQRRAKIVSLMSKIDKANMGCY
jgi:monofunctional biosynthetic peptidoglycan transglycosylase